jgi:glutamyl/glutaminyl-tRNA synthetase
VLLDSRVAHGKTRIAPTPSGYLHRGNLVHIVFVEALATRESLAVHLRIDAFDAPRVRPEYVQDIFRALAALDISWTSGPRSPADVNDEWNGIDWSSELHDAADRGLVTYACHCSRRDRSLQRPCTCREERIVFRPGQSALRLDAEPSGLAESLHGTLLWRRDDVPSTHLASVMSDRNSQITHVIRGADLADASACQRAIAPFFGADNVASATFVHHPLIETVLGEKLSKSAGAAAAPLDISPEIILELREIAAGLPGDG